MVFVHIITDSLSICVGSNIRSDAYIQYTCGAQTDSNIQPERVHMRRLSNEVNDLFPTLGGVLSQRLRFNSPTCAVCTQSVQGKVHSFECFDNKQTLMTVYTWSADHQKEEKQSWRNPLRPTEKDYGCKFLLQCFLNNI